MCTCFLYESSMVFCRRKRKENEFHGAAEKKKKKRKETLPDRIQ
jgi:hypothetical protein